MPSLLVSRHFSNTGRSRISSICILCLKLHITPNMQMLRQKSMNYRVQSQIEISSYETFQHCWKMLKIGIIHVQLSRYSESSIWLVSAVQLELLIIRNFLFPAVELELLYYFKYKPWTRNIKLECTWIGSHLMPGSRSKFIIGFVEKWRTLRS